MDKDHYSMKKLFLNASIMFIIITSNDTFMFGTNSNQLLLLVPRVVGIFFIFIFSIMNIHRKVSLKDFTLLSILLTIILLSGIFNNGQFETIISRLIPVVLAFLIVQLISRYKFAEIFNRLLYVLSIVAIIIYILVLIASQIIHVFPVVENVSGVNFSYFILGGVIHSSLINSGIQRSTSIFWEPGAFAVYLVISIYFEIFVLKNRKISNKRLIIYLVALLTTLSTTGFISLGVLFIAFFLSDDFKKSKPIVRLLPMISIVSLLFILIFGQETFIFQNVFRKIIDNQSTSITRYASLVNGLEIGFDYPLLGVFSNNVSVYMEIYARKTTLFDFGGNYMNTNTVTYQFAAFGAVFGSIFLLGTYNFFSKSKNKKLVDILCFISILMAYSGELFYSFLPFIFVFYGFKRIDIPQREEKYV